MSVDTVTGELNVAPGSVVRVRDEDWVVTDTEPPADGTLVRVQGLTELVHDATAAFYSSIDEIEVVNPAKSTVVADDTPNYRRSLNEKLMAKLSGDASIMGLLGLDQMTLLWEWANRPDPEVWTKFSELVPMMLLQQKAEPTDGDEIYSHAAELAQSENNKTFSAGTVPSWHRKLGHFVFSAAGFPNSLSTVAVGLCIDDRAEGVAEEGHEASWRERLRLANLLAFTPIGITIGSVVSSIEDGESVEQEAIRREMTDELSPAWNELLEQATDDEKEILVGLARAEIAKLPDLGFEVDGVPVSIAWPQQIGVLFASDERAELEAAGWTIVGAGVEEIRNGADHEGSMTCHW